MTIEIVNEVRRARETYAAQFHYDLDAIFADLRRRRRGTRRKVVNLSKRKQKPFLAALEPERRTSAAKERRERRAPSPRDERDAGRFGAGSV